MVLYKINRMKKKNMLSLKVFFILTRLFTKLKIINVNGAGMRQLAIVA